MTQGRHTARVGRHNGRTCIFVDDTPIPGVAILSPVPGKGEKVSGTAVEGLEAGIKILLVTIGGVWNGPGICQDWIGPGKWDFAGGIQHLARLREVAPDSWIMIRINLNAPTWWLEANPGECARHADSEGPEGQASMGSERWINDSSEFLAAAAAALESSPEGERIIGYSILNSHGGEWVYAGAGAGRVGDYSEPAERYYRAWLRRRYGDADWIATARIPSEDERKRSLPALLRDPERDARVTDFDLAFSDMTVDNLLAWCRAIKRATGGRRLVGAFYGYLVWQTGLVNSAATNGHLSLRRLLESPDIDFVTSFPSYDTREPGGAAQILTPVESIQAAGKLAFNECDDRTHLTSAAPPIRFGLARDQRDPADGPQLWAGMWNVWRVETEQIAVDVMRREFAHHLIRGAAFWWFDMEGGWYAAPGILADFRKQAEIARQALEWDMASISQAAGVVSAASPASHSFMRMHDVDPQAALVELQADLSTREMHKAGAPIDWWMADDLARPEMRRYKALYFHNLTILSDAEHKALEDLKGDGRTMVFVGYPGIVAGGALDEAAASRVTGMRLRLRAERAASRFHVTDYDLPWTRECMSQISFGSGAVVSPRLVVDDPDAEVIARWSDGYPAAAMKRHDGWTAFYFPVPPNNAWMFRGILREAGCHIYTHSTCRDVVYANRSLLAIHSSHYGQPVTLPTTARVTDLFTGKVVVEKGNRINLGRSWHSTGGSHLFRVECDPPVR